MELSPHTLNLAGSHQTKGNQERLIYCMKNSLNSLPCKMLLLSRGFSCRTVIIKTAWSAKSLWMIFLTFADSTLEMKSSKRRPRVDFTTWHRRHSALGHHTWGGRSTVRGSGTIKHLLALTVLGFSRRQEVEGVRWGGGWAMEISPERRTGAAMLTPVSWSHRTTHCVKKK